MTNRLIAWPSRIRTRAARNRDGEPVREIARSYNVSHSTISRLTGKFCAVAALVALLTITGSAQADTPEPWQMPWSSVKADSAQKCAKVFDTFQMQAVCMDNEKQGYEKMQSDFGMPTNVATNAKAKCTKIFDMFQMQAVCMDNEKKDTNR